MSILAYREPDSQWEAIKQNCDYNDTPDSPDKVCKVDISSWSPCVKENNYNYHNAAPCIFLKLNKVILLQFLIAWVRCMLLFWHPFIQNFYISIVNLTLYQCEDIFLTLIIESTWCLVYNIHDFFKGSQIYWTVMKIDRPFRLHN